MIEFFEWFVHIPEYLGAFGNWLMTPIAEGLPFTPLQMLGASAVTAIAAVVVFKVVHLVNPFG